MEPTNASEIEVIIGCMFTMCYNRVPSLKDYWSAHKSLGNHAVKNAITRDRFLMITSKMYFSAPEKPSNCPKTYYVNDLVECLKKTFQTSRQDSVYQSIDESMTKFKGRSTPKQYMPLKPVKRGIKMWLRCDASTGYTYDFNIYSGKGLEQLEGTLGERVVNKLASTIIEPDVNLCFDRFFTSVKLLDSITYPAVGTIMSNRKNVPKFGNKLQRGEAEFKGTSFVLLCVKWQDTKEVLVMSNCHNNEMEVVTKTLKTEQKIQVPCPKMIKFYREIMGGVDLADQMNGFYEYDRKSDKWWKKTFYRLIMMAAVNAWVIHSEMNRQKMPFKIFLVNLSESLIDQGLENTAVRRSNHRGRQSNSGLVVKHLPIEGTSRRRCVSCSRAKKQTRTKTLCKECELPLCKNCCAPYHS